MVETHNKSIKTRPILHVFACMCLHFRNLSPFLSPSLSNLTRLSSLILSDMADRTNPSHRPIYGSTTVPRSNTFSHPIASLIRQLQSHAPNHYSRQRFGFLAFFISGGVLLLLTGITVTASVLGFIAFLPIIIISSPIWIPLFLIATGFLSLAGFLFATGAVVSWTYRYFKGMHPLGSDQVDYARSRIYDTAAHVKDYAGVYFHGKLKDAAPGA